MGRDCRHHGGRFATLTKSGRVVELCRCAVFSHCTDAAEGVRRGDGTPYGVCGGCEQYEAGDQNAASPSSVGYEFPPCVYRGEKIEDKEADLCGMRGFIFEVRACNHYDVPGRCVATRICQRQEEMPCSTCERREMPDDLETVP